MIDSYSATGGARVGWVNATWPLARLTANREKIVLNVSLIGEYTFAPDQIIAIEKYTTIPILGWGIRIRHNVQSYPAKIIFWCLGSPDALINKITETGFEATADIHSMPPDRGMPVRWQALVAIILLWNFLLMADMSSKDNINSQPGFYTFCAVFLIFIGSALLWRVKWLQRLILKPGREPGEIKAWLYLLSFISGFMTIMFLIASDQIF